MINENILKQFKEKVDEKVSITTQGVNRFLIDTPFIFEDGDHLVIILKYNKETKEWFLTDEGHTFLHLSYFMDEKDFLKGTREKIILESRKMFGVNEKKGELTLLIKDNAFGDALYDFVQCLLKIMDITYLERERVKSTFFEDFKISINSIIQKQKLKVKFDYYFEEKDSKHLYRVDCYIETIKKPIFVFAINNDNKCKDAIISIFNLEKMGLEFHPVGIFEDQTSISRKVLAMFSDVSEKQISTLDKMDRFEKYLESYIKNS